MVVKDQFFGMDYIVMIPTRASLRSLVSSVKIFRTMLGGKTAFCVFFSVSSTATPTFVVSCRQLGKRVGFLPLVILLLLPCPGSVFVSVFCLSAPVLFHESHVPG